MVTHAGLTQATGIVPFSIHACRPPLGPPLYSHKMGPFKALTQFTDLQSQFDRCSTGSVLVLLEVFNGASREGLLVLTVPKYICQALLECNLLLLSTNPSVK